MFLKWLSCPGLRKITLSVPCVAGPWSDRPMTGVFSCFAASSIWIVVICGCLLSQAAFATQITVSLDRNPVPLSESFTLTFAADEEPDGDPDFAPLEANFELLSQGKSSQASIINGEFKHQLTWQVQVLAKKPGTLEIPVIHFGGDQSKPFSVTITNGAVQSRHGGDANIFMEAVADPPNPYVQSQVILSIRVLSRVAFSGDLGQPEVADAIVEKLDEDREYTTVRDGVQFKVDERRFVLFPQKSGRLTVGPVNLNAQIAASGGAGYQQFFMSPNRRQRLHTDPVHLDVRPIPAQFTGKHWLPAANIELTEVWSPAELEATAGEPLTRSVTVKAEGVGVGMIPELQGPDLSVKDARQYPDQPATREERTNDGLISFREQKVALIPNHSGSLKVSGLEIPWWNTRTDRMEIARLPERTLTVLPSTQAPVPQPAATTEEKPVKPLSPDSASKNANALDDNHAQADRLWFWLAVLMGSGWLLSALAWWFFSRRPDSKPLAIQHPQSSVSDQPQIAAVRRACETNDPGDARKAFDSWVLARWPGATADEIERFMGERLLRQSRILSENLYSAQAGAAPWQGGDLRNAFDDYLKDSSVKSQGSSSKPGLQPLFPDLIKGSDGPSSRG